MISDTYSRLRSRSAGFLLHNLLRLKKRRMCRNLIFSLFPVKPVTATAWSCTIFSLSLSKAGLMSYPMLINWYMAGKNLKKCVR